MMAMCIKKAVAGLNIFTILVMKQFHTLRVKTSYSMRSERIAHIQDTMQDLNRQLQYKERRREQSSTSLNFRLCEELTTEISSLKQQRFELQAELKILKWKQQQSASYRRKKTKRGTAESSNDQQGSGQSELESDGTQLPTPSSSSTPYPSSTPSRSPTPAITPTSACSSHGSSSRPSTFSPLSPAQPTRFNFQLPSSSTEHYMISDSDNESHFQ